MAAFYFLVLGPIFPSSGLGDFTVGISVSVGVGLGEVGWGLGSVLGLGVGFRVVVKSWG